ncbi:MAG: twin-arginine translocase TatA/TatE family subunit [Candidatus Eremiobacteraeota bacterium]|nr:twin-arginine translocase TatA/TatE family subunit [Candidatus Eremiobacteraeota bacterium]
MAILGAAALLFFGPEQLPRIARKAGNVMREVQNTSASFIRELERAADIEDVKDAKPYEPPAYEPPPDESAYEPAAYDAAPYVAAPYDGGVPYDTSRYEPPAPDPEAPKTAAPKSAASAPAGAGEKLAEPRPALDLQASAAAEPPPEPDHAPHL